MAYSVNWITKIITIPVSDMILVSGSEYDLSMLSFMAEVRRLEWEFLDGLWADPILDHTNQKTLAGTTYFGFDEIINGYTVTFDPTATRVNLKDSNNNIVDVFNVNGVSVVPSNTAGGSVTNKSGLTQEESDTLLSSIPNIELDTAFFHKTLKNRKELLKIGDIWYLIIYDDDDSTELVRKVLTDSSGNNIDNIAAGALAAELKSSV